MNHHILEDMTQLSPSNGKEEEKLVRVSVFVMQ